MNSFSLFEESAQAASSSEIGAMASEALTGTAKEAEDTVIPEPKAEFTVPEQVAAMYQRGLADALSASEKMSAFVGLDYGAGFDPFEDAGRKIPDRNGLNKALFEAIVRSAKATGLASPGNYEISRHDFDRYLKGLNHHDGYDSDSKVKVNILGLCKAIYAAYGGDSGKRVEHNRVAKSLISAFSLDKAKIEVKSGMVELSQHSYLERRYSGGGYEISYNSQTRVREILGNLKHVFSESGMHLSNGPLEMAMADYKFRPEPNKTVFSGQVDDEPFTVKVFKHELKWKFTEACIAVISDFVVEYGPQD